MDDLYGRHLRASFQLGAFSNKPFDHATRDPPPLLAHPVAEFGNARRFRATQAIHRLWRDIEPSHDARVLADKIQFRHILVKTDLRREDEAAAIRAEQLIG